MQAYRDIYGHATRNKKMFIKGTWYEADAEFPGIVSVRDPAQHSRQRKYLAHAFSAKALRSQEFIIHQYVDMFLFQLGRIGNSDGSGINLDEAFNWLTFDIIGNTTCPMSCILFRCEELTWKLQAILHSASHLMLFLKAAQTCGCHSSLMPSTT